MRPKKPMKPKGTAINSLAKLWACCLLAALSLPAFAADFKLEDMQGRTLSLSDYRGKWVLVNFWATWCPPCLAEIPELKALAASHKDIVVIGIAMEYGSPGIVADFVRKHRIGYPIVLGDRKVVSQIGDLDVLPTSYLYSPTGEQVSVQRGELTRAGVESYIKNRPSR